MNHGGHGEHGGIRGPGLGGWITICMMALPLLVLAGLWRAFELLPNFRSAPDYQPRHKHAAGDASKAAARIHSKAAARSFFVFLLAVACFAGAVLPAAAQEPRPAALSTLAEKAPDGAGNWQENLAWVLGLAILGMQFVSQFKPSPALHKQFADKTETENYRAELKKMIDGLDKKLTQWSSDQYAARRRMHHKLNAMQNALMYFAGKLEADGDSAAADRLRSMVERGNSGGNGDE